MFVHLRFFNLVYLKCQTSIKMRKEPFPTTKGEMFYSNVMFIKIVITI